MASCVFKLCPKTCGLGTRGTPCLALGCLYQSVWAAVTKILQTEGHINSRHLFLTVLATGKSTIMEPADSVSGGSPPAGRLSCVLTGQEGRGHSLGSHL